MSTRKSPRLPCIPALPENCLLISYDLECQASGPPNKPEEWVIPKAANGLGAAAFLWPERKLVPLPLAEATFHRSIVPVVARNAIASRFWTDNPDAEKVIHRKPVPMKVAALDFLNWMVMLKAEFGRKLALIAGPHFFDVAQLADVMESAQLLNWLQESTTLHDVRDSIAHHAKVDTKIARQRYEVELKALSWLVAHLDDHDSVAQGLAFFKALDAK